jgi:hypothetical protein
MARKIMIILTGLIAALITSYGCYTIIKHPSVMESEADRSGVHEGASKDCVSCHADYHQYPYGYYYSYYPDYYWNYPRWGTYYAYPWWWDNYWYNGQAAGGANYGDAGSGGATSPHSGSKPPARRGMLPPYVGGYDTLISSPPIFGIPVTPGPIVVPPASGGTTTGGTVTTPPPTNTKDTSKKEESKPPKRRK